MIKITVPATTANFGSGFDSIGAALTLYNEVFMDFSSDDEDDAAALDSSTVPPAARNLICISAHALMKEYGVPERPLIIRQRNNIPMARGLGSSSACIAAGLLGANELLGGVAGKAGILRLAARLEGHPDNVVPAILGGAVVCCTHKGEVLYGKTEIHPDLCFAAFVPDFKLNTSQAREILPQTAPIQDAVYNIGRSGLLVWALSNRRYDLLRQATKDRLHQSFRLKLMDGGPEIIEYALANGAYAAFVSGAGSSVMVLADPENEQFFTDVSNFLGSNTNTERFSVIKLYCDNSGAKTETVGDIQ